MGYGIIAGEGLVSYMKRSDIIKETRIRMRRDDKDEKGGKEGRKGRRKIRRSNDGEKKGER